MAEALDSAFVIVGPGRGVRKEKSRPARKAAWKGKPVLSAVILGVIVLCCLFAEHVCNHDPTGFYLEHLSLSLIHI